MKAILLAGGQGTRLRPLTLHTPKPVVPIFNRPFLYYQIDLLRQIPEIDEVILSLNYKPDLIEAVVGDGAGTGVRIRYVVEPAPLGTGGAVKYAAQGVTDTVIVFNGDVLTQIDLAAVLRRHRESGARATIVLTPVENPSAYGLVETDARGHITRFLEKPSPDEITTNHINAGICVLEPSTFDRIPDGVAWSIERKFFPSFVERGETFVAYIYDGYWIDIGTPAQYARVHRDIMDGRFEAMPFIGANGARQVVMPTARVDQTAVLDGPCFVGEDVVVEAGARVGPYAVLGRGSHAAAQAAVTESIVWPDCRLDVEAAVTGSLLGRNCRIGQCASLDGAILGDETVVGDYSRA
jgi:NDP-sugar pyrophosphorylase family protein